MLEVALTALLVAQAPDVPGSDAPANAVPANSGVPAAEAAPSATTAPRVDYNRPDPDRGVANYLLPVALVPGGVNMLYWLPGKFVLRDYFADISADTMRGNIRHGWVFDDDIFAINQFGHPYQGGGYYNVARSFGLSFWESAPYATLGSLTWEYLMESGPACCYPSVNDLVTTTVGGIAVGEVLWRLSNSVLDDSTRGFERAAREAAALLVDPPHGLYRLASGDAFADGPAPLRPYDIWGEVSAGASLFGSGKAEDFAVIPRYRLRHGRIGELPADFAAFDHFTLDLALGIARSGVVGATFDVSGLTNGVKVDLGGDQNAVIGTAVDFDFFENVLASLSVSSLGGLVAAEWPLRDELRLFGRLMLLGGFGGITSEYPDIRHYNFGFGATARLWVELQHARWGEVYAKVDRYWIHTSSGMPGNELAGVLDVGGTVALLPELGVGFHYLLADKGGYYSTAADTYEMIHLGEGYIAWRF